MRLRSALRSALFVLAAALTHCAAPVTAFAQEAVAESPAAFETERPQAPEAPVPTPPAPDTIAATEAEDATPSAVEEVVEAWFQKHFHGLGPNLTEYLHGRLRAAVDDLKELLRALPIS